MSNKVEKHHHHILPNKTIFTVGGTLLLLTLFTVFIAGVDLGPLNFAVAMLVATVKALLVALFFMNLLYDRRENGVIFGTSFLFLAIFVVLTSTDLFFRGNVYLKKGEAAFAAAPETGGAKNPWISTPELVAKGKTLFAGQCVACHGAEGKGDGPAAAALVPKPRNFTAAEGWKNGRKASDIYKTLKEGIPGSAMSSFATLPSDDRWALSHYVVSLEPSKPGEVTPEDLKKIGINPQGGGAEAVAPTIPVELAMDRMAVQPETIPTRTRAAGQGLGAHLYAEKCASCHGMSGEGGIPSNVMGVNPVALVMARPFTAQMETLRSPEAFRKVVINGVQGNIMPGYGQFTDSELTELYQYVQSLK